MANTERGTKRQCLNCSTKFYDLNRDPILCPSCGTKFIIEAAKPLPIVREKEKVKEKVTEEDDTDEVAVVAGAEVISLGDLEDDDDDDDNDDGDDIPEVEDVEVDDDLAGDDADVFLEDDDDDDDDIGIDVAKDRDDV